MDSYQKDSDAAWMGFATGFGLNASNVRLWPDQCYAYAFEIITLESL